MSDPSGLLALCMQHKSTWDKTGMLKLHSVHYNFSTGFEPLQDEGVVQMARALTQNAILTELS